MDIQISNPSIRSPAPPRPNTEILFPIFDENEAFLVDSPSPFVIGVWAYYLDQYPGDLGILGITLQKILRHGCYIGYGGSKEIFNSSRNAKSFIISKVLKLSLETDLSESNPMTHSSFHEGYRVQNEGAIRAKPIGNYLSHFEVSPVDRGYNLEVFDDNPWISRTLAGFTRLQPTKSKRKSTPLTIDLLHHIVRKPTGLQPPILIDNLNFETAALVAFTGFLRPSEFTYDATHMQDRYDFERTELLRSDIFFSTNNDHAILHLKRSKPDYKLEGGLATTHDGCWRKTHDLSYKNARSFNGNIKKKV